MSSGGYALQINTGPGIKVGQAFTSDANGVGTCKDYKKGNPELYDINLVQPSLNVTTPVNGLNIDGGWTKVPIATQKKKTASMQSFLYTSKLF